MLGKDGNYRWFESVGQATWGRDGKPLRMVGSIIDVDRKKQLEIQLSNDERELRIQKTELQRALDQLSEIQKVAGIGTWEVELETMTAYWSDKVYEIHGVPVGTEIQVEDGINFYREDYRPVIQKAIDAAIAENKSWNEECVLVNSRGEEIWVRAIGYPVYELGELKRLRGLFMSIDEEKAKELERIENATKLSLALDASGIGIWEWNLKTDELNWDSQMLKIYGLERHTFTNYFESYSSMVLEEDLVRIEKELEEVVKARTRFDSEFRIRKPDGSTGHIVAKANLVLDENGSPIKMIGINYDVSELYKLLSDKEALLGEVHHRVKNNLALISSFLQLEQLDKSKSISPDQILSSNILRVKSIGVVHEIAYKQGSFSEINILELLEMVLANSFSNKEDIFKKLEKPISQKPVTFSINLAIPFALLISELMFLISNLKGAFKYAPKTKLSPVVSEHENEIQIQFSQKELTKIFASLNQGTEVSFTEIIIALLTQLKAKIVVDERAGISKIVFENRKVKGSSSAI